MKKLSPTLAVFALIVAPFAVSGNAAAADCTISNTGPGSDNSCVVEKDYTCEVSNDNDVAIINDNTQVALSGDGESEDSTNSGDVRTGSATNENGTVFSVTVTNDGTCTVAATNPKPPVVTPEKEDKEDDKPGMGAVDIPSAPVAPVAAPQVAAPTVLPNTSADSTLGYLVAGISLLAATALGSRFAVSTYSRLKS